MGFAATWHLSCLRCLRFAALGILLFTGAHSITSMFKQPRSLCKQQQLSTHVSPRGCVSNWAPPTEKGIGFQFGFLLNQPGPPINNLTLAPWELPRLVLSLRRCPKLATVCCFFPCRCGGLRKVLAQNHRLDPGFPPFDQQEPTLV